MSIFDNDQKALPASTLVVLDAGTGVDFLFANAKANIPFNGPITFDEPIPRIEQQGRYIVIDVAQMTGSDVDIDASLSLDLGAYSGSAYADLLSKIQVSSRSFCIFVQVQVINGGGRISRTQIGSLAFSNVANNLLPTGTAKNYIPFYNLYGDSFVSSKIVGGEFLFLATVTCATAEKKEEIRGELKAQGAWVAGETDTKITTWANTAGVTIKVDHRVIGTNVPIPAVNGSTDPHDLASVINYANNFGTYVSNAPRETVLYYGLTGYDEVAQLSQSYAPRTELQSTKLKALASWYNAYRVLSKTLEDVLNRPYAYDLPSDVSSLNKFLGDLQNRISSNMDNAKKGASYIQELTDQTKLNEIPQKVWIDGGTQVDLTDPKVLASQLPQMLDYYFKITLPDGLTKLSPDIKYRPQLNSSQNMSACLINGRFRHTGLNDKAVIISRDIWYVRGIEEDIASLEGDFDQKTLLTHRVRKTSQVLVKGNLINFIDENGVQIYAEIMR
jgi:hypothetical protein